MSTTSTQQTPSERITEAVTAWAGVEAAYGTRGEWAFTVGGRQIGHLHGDRVAHFGFPREVGAELRAQGLVGPHPVNPHSTKLAARPIASDDDIRDVIALMRINYDRIADGVRRSVFSEAEVAYLHGGGRRLGRLATVGADGTPHVVPVGWSHNRDLDTIDVGGRDLSSSKKFRDVARTGRAAIVVDDLASVDPWRPRGIEVRGRAEAVTGERELIRIHPERVVSWGLEPRRSARTVRRAA
jgi:pyridoxamine 5'-phosphate oxidase family protein